MGNLDVKTTVTARDGFGRFISACEEAATEVVRKAIEDGAALSRDMAPVGDKVDRRTVPLKESITTEVLSRTSGRWVSTARHALPIEFGAGPHDIPANVSFFWEKLGRMWLSPSAYQRLTGYPGADPIHHPGNAAQPYLRPAQKMIASRMSEYAKRYYPG